MCTKTHTVQLRSDVISIKLKLLCIHHVAQPHNEWIIRGNKFDTWTRIILVNSHTVTLKLFVYLLSFLKYVVQFVPKFGIAKILLVYFWVFYWKCYSTGNNVLCCNVNVFHRTKIISQFLALLIFDLHLLLTLVVKWIRNRVLINSDRNNSMYFFCFMSIFNWCTLSWHQK